MAISQVSPQIPRNFIGDIPQCDRDSSSFQITSASVSGKQIHHLQLEYPKSSKIELVKSIKSQ